MTYLILGKMEVSDRAACCCRDVQNIDADDVDADDLAVRILDRLNVGYSSVEREGIFWGLTLDVLVHSICNLERTTPTKDQHRV